jgi:hypothetical protein
MKNSIEYHPQTYSVYFTREELYDLVSILEKASFSLPEACSDCCAGEIRNPVLTSCSTCLEKLKEVILAINEH